MTVHNYIFLKSDSSLRILPKTTLAAYKKEFTKKLVETKDVIANTYATTGLKVNTNILLWFQADKIDTIQDLLNRLLHTRLGEHLTITYTLLGLARPTQYSPASKQYLDTNRKGGKHLIIYPFTKTKEWHMLDFDNRRELMKGHIMIGKKYPQITQLLLYSYGVDNNEFIVSYETDDLSDFQKLVMELRSDKVRAYTLNDTPIFTCIYKSLEEALDFL
jgi:chlorite dismutase